MNFDFIGNVEFNNNFRNVLIDNVITAEWQARIDPSGSLTAARIALESLVSGIFTERGEKIKPLFDMINDCIKWGCISNELESYVHNVRIRGNKGAVHPYAELRLREATDENVKLAVENLKDLHFILKSHFGIDVEFDENRIPFGDYKVIRMVPKADNEVIAADFNYFVRENDGDEYFLQCVPITDDEEAMAFVNRSEEARALIRDSIDRKTYLCETTVRNLYGNRTRLVLYSIPCDSFLLSEYTNKKYTNRQIVRIGLDLIESLLELEGAGDGIHHRNINPGCVVLAPKKNYYLAYLVDMQTAKIENSLFTVIPQLAEKHKNNPYIPADVRQMPLDKQLVFPWEKVDVYSVAKTVLYCINPEAVKASYDTERALAEMEEHGFSSDFVDFFENILDGNTVNNPSLKKMKEVFKDELEQCD